MTAPEPEAMANAFRPGVTPLSPAAALAVERRQRLLGPAYRLFYDHPIYPVRAEGVWIQDRDGKTYLDAYNNVACLGHAHPRVVAAVAEQMARLNTHTRYIQDGILDYAESLLASFPAALGHVMFTCSGSEANDLALRIASEVTGGTGIIVTRHAYHGVTSVLAGLSPSLGAGNRLGDHVQLIDLPDPASPDPSADFASAVSAALASFARAGIRPAAILFDTIFSSDGVYADPPGFFNAGVSLARQAGALFIADEVQPGFGRIGPQMWNFRRHGAEPDMVSMGKPMGNGYPVAALVVKPALLEQFGAKTRYFNTFGGSSAAIAAANAVWQVLAEQDLPQNAETVGRYFRQRLADYIGRNGITAVRGCGLFLAVDFHRDGQPWAKGAHHLVNAMRERGVLISATGRAANILKIRPPLVFSAENVDFFMDRFDSALADLHNIR